MSAKKGFSKFFKNSKQISIPDSAKSEILPREQNEIDKEYTQLCISIGDRRVKIEGLEEEIQQMLNYARKLGAESAKRQELNKAAAVQTSATNIAPQEPEVNNAQV